MRRFFSMCDHGVEKLIEAICIALTGGLFVVISLVVATRLGGFGSPAWSDEIVEFMLAWLIFIGAAGLWRQQQHFRVDLLEQMITDPRTLRWLAITVELLCVVFLSILTYYGSLFAVLANDTSPTFALPRIYWFAAMPVSSGLMLVYSLIRVWHLVRSWALPATGVGGSPMEIS